MVFKLGDEVEVRFVGAVTGLSIGIGGSVRIQVEGRDKNEEFNLAIVPEESVTMAKQEEMNVN